MDPVQWNCDESFTVIMVMATVVIVIVAMVIAIIIMVKVIAIVKVAVTKCFVLITVFKAEFINFRIV